MLGETSLRFGCNQVDDAMRRIRCNLRLIAARPRTYLPMLLLPDFAIGGDEHRPIEHRQVVPE